MNFFRRLTDRLREPTTGLGLAGLFGLFLPTVAPVIPDLVNTVGTLAGLVMAIVAPERVALDPVGVADELRRRGVRG